MTMLLGSQKAIDDREMFFKSQILFWMLAAIDGHGKNFSIFIESGTSFRLTPLYDVLSAFPIFQSRGIETKKAKMAMALQGKNKQYHFSMIQPRHFISTATQVGFSPKMATQLMLDMTEKTDAVITAILPQLSEDFPEHISKAIFAGLLKQADKIKRWSSSQTN